MTRRSSFSKAVSTMVALAMLFVASTAMSEGQDGYCEPIYKKSVMALDFNPAFLHVDAYADGDGTSDGLTISSFFNAAFINPPGQMPPMGFFERDLVARITNLDSLDYENFDAATDVEPLTDLSPGMPKTVWPNEAVVAPAGVFPFEAVVIPQGFMSAGFPGRLTAIRVDTKEEYLIHQSTQNPEAEEIIPGDPDNSPRFYHRALFIDMDQDGFLDIVTVRSGMRFGPTMYPPFSELVYFRNPGELLDAGTPWHETVLYGGPAAGFMGPDMSLAAYDFEDDGVVEIVATHFFTGDSAPPTFPPTPPTNGKITIYGAPVGGDWTDVNATYFMLPRIKDISTDQGFPFDVQVDDLNRDGLADILATNHQPDNQIPPTMSAIPGRVYALEQPASGDIFSDEWTLRVLLDDIRPNPSVQPFNPPGRMAPGHAKTFFPVRFFEFFTKPWILVSGDEAGKVWVLRPENLFDEDNWNYNASVIFDLNDFYGPGTTQTPVNGITNSTIGAAAVRYDSSGLLGRAEIFVPAFEAKDIHVFSYRRSCDADRIQCL